MVKETYTPGPWYVATDCSDCGFPDNRYIVQKCGDIEHPIATITVGVKSCVRGTSSEEKKRDIGEKNACLISAAPEMYTALLEARKAITVAPKEALGIGGEGETHWYLADELLRQIDMAIAKAKGEIYEE